MNLIEYLIRADSCRKTRFHDQRNNFVGLAGLLYAPLAFWSMVLRRLFDYRPVLPWFPYQVIKTLDRLIERDWNVLEFGSGMSTVWLAQRCRFLHSIESDPDWHGKVSVLLAKRGLISRVRYDLRHEATYGLVADWPDGFFDLCIIDGIHRAECVAHAIIKVRTGGYIYWDNSDNADGDARDTERLLLEAVKGRRGELKYCVGFAPTICHVNQGLLARL